MKSGREAGEEGGSGKEWKGRRVERRRGEMKGKREEGEKGWNRKGRKE